MTVRQEEGVINNVAQGEIVAALTSLQTNPLYLTEPAYRGNSEKWPDHQISFIDFHLGYLKSQPTLNPWHYLSNLKLKLRKKV